MNSFLRPAGVNESSEQASRAVHANRWIRPNLQISISIAKGRGAHFDCDGLTRFRNKNLRNHLRKEARLSMHVVVTFDLVFFSAEGGTPSSMESATLRIFFSKSTENLHQPWVASPIIFVCLYFSNLSQAFDPIFRGLSIWP